MTDKTCLTCDYSDIEPTGEGFCMYEDIEVKGNNNACEFYRKIKEIPVELEFNH